jgi:hypothetical protein
MTNSQITKEKIEDYLDKTKRALAKINVVAPDRSHSKKIATDFLNMATSYYSDAVHFYESGEYVNAFACVNYSHGWLDAGARMGFFDVGSDDTLFTLAD